MYIQCFKFSRSKARYWGASVNRFNKVWPQPHQLWVKSKRKKSHSAVNTIYIRTFEVILELIDLKHCLSEMATIMWKVLFCSIANLSIWKEYKEKDLGHKLFFLSRTSYYLEGMANNSLLSCWRELVFVKKCNCKLK